MQEHNGGVKRGIAARPPLTMSKHGAQNDGSPETHGAARLTARRGKSRIIQLCEKNEVESRLIGLFSKPHSPGRTTTNINKSGKTMRNE